MTIAAAVLIGLGGMLLVLLTTPVRADLHLALATEGHADLTVRMRWLFLSWQTDGTRRPSRAAARRRRRPRRSRRRTTSPGRALAVGRAALGTPRFRRGLRQLIRDLAHVVAPRRVWVRARLGLDDPAATGQWVWALSTIAATPHPAWDIAVTPEFSEATFEGQARLSWSIRPGALLWPVARFALSPVTWATVWSTWRQSVA